MSTYETDQLTPEERETRIVAAIAELERNPNASRRGVARNHGLPESTLRGRMKKLHINYKKADMKISGGGSGSSGNRPPRVPAQHIPSSSSSAISTAVSAVSASAAAHQQQALKPQQQATPHQQIGQQHHQGGAGTGANAGTRSVAQHHVTKSSIFTQNMYADYYTKQRYNQTLSLNATTANNNNNTALNNNRSKYGYQYEQQQQQAQHQQAAALNPEPQIAGFRPPPGAQVATIEYYARVDRNYQPDTGPVGGSNTEEEDISIRELKPKLSMNTLSKKAIPVKILQTHMIAFDDEGNNSEILTEKKTDFEDKEKRQSKIDKCVEEMLAKNSRQSVRELSSKYSLPESTIRRALIAKKTQATEYSLSDELETRILHVLKKTNSHLVDDVDIANQLKFFLNSLITDFIKQDFYSQNGNLKEMLDDERIEEIGIDFLYKYSDEIVGNVKLAQLLVE